MSTVTATPAPASVTPAPFPDELLTVSEVAELLKCKESSIYNMTRRRGQMRYDNPLPVIRAPFGLRFKKSSVLAWLNQQEQGGAQ